jgi:hypothetical protein
MESKSGAETKAGSCEGDERVVEGKCKDATPRIGAEGKSADDDAERSSSKRPNGDVYEDDAMPDLTDTSDLAVMKRASRYCFSHAFIDVFQQYIEKHAHIFFPAVHEEEHRLE